MGIEKGEIQVFFTWPDQLASLEACCQALSPQEREKAFAHAFEKDQRLSLVAWAQIRYLFSELVGTPAQDFVFSRDRSGKPNICPGTPGQGIWFSLSHTRGMVVSAFSLDSPLGVDVERLDRRLDLDLARRYFGPEEAGQIQAAEDPQEMFFRFWTLKEAFLKAEGQGLALGLDAACFDLSGPRTIGLSKIPGTKGWQFFQFRPDSGTVAALAISGFGPFSLSFHACVPFAGIRPLSLGVVSSPDPIPGLDRVSGV